jgi:hypothetical protein
MRHSLLVAPLLVAAGAHAGVLEKLFAPKAELWPRWTESDEASSRRVDHGTWDRFLKTYVMEGRDGINRVAYGRVSERDRVSLSGYVKSLSSTPISHYSRSEQFAYWVNLYNALTLQTVLKHYPVKSIRDIDISGGLFAKGPWGKKLVEVEGEAVSLDDIEHRILRPIWRDPRIHYAVNCAALGCPNLQPSAFTASNAEDLLARGARDFVNHPRGVRVSGDSFTLSSIYSWFEADFAKDGGVSAHVRRYASPDLAAKLKRFDRAPKYEYDWALNDTGAGSR